MPDTCLLHLEGPLLMVVLQCLEDDPASWYSAAMACKTLHWAAVAAMRSISAAVPEHRGADIVLPYLEKYGSRVDSLKLFGPQGIRLTLHQLPASLQLHNLELERWKVQLLPAISTGRPTVSLLPADSQGVLGLAAAAAGGPPLKQLRLHRCTLLDGVEVLAKALLQLPALEHLSLRSLKVDGANDDDVCFPTGVLQQLMRLTYVDLEGADLQGPDEASPALQPLQALTRVAHLRLLDLCPADLAVTASMFSGMHDLTHLVINKAAFQPGALDGKTKLQHLMLGTCTVGGAAGVAALLAQLQPMQQLTYLDLDDSLGADTPNPKHQGALAGTGEDQGNPSEDVERVCAPAAAYSALTASSKLQHLNISQGILPAGLWQQLFPADRQLPHLRDLNISYVKEPPGREYLAPEHQQLASCCPGLQHLVIKGLQCSEDQLRELRAVATTDF
jgi:hypothetical protein